MIRRYPVTVRAVIVETITTILSFGVSLLVLWAICAVFGWDFNAVLPYYTLFAIVDHKVTKWPHPKVLGR